MDHSPHCRCPECDPDPINNDAAIAAQEDNDPSLQYWATYPVDTEAIRNTPPPHDDDPF